MNQSYGSVSLGNKRAGAAAKPGPGEIAIDIDRRNPILGNRHILHNHLDDVERAQVIAAYKRDYDADWQINGPMARATREIAERVRKGQQLKLMCWCSGAPLNKPCHGDLIITRIKEILQCD